MSGEPCWCIAEPTALPLLDAWIEARVKQPPVAGCIAPGSNIAEPTCLPTAAVLSDD